ncbi:hypothetical protein, partial [Streptomyces albidoflavus]|uniref:hypothetical protein n=1 Tax=Streptomyces albidoflavus TaxID=1886 RepID=UPI001140A7B1
MVRSSYGHRAGTRAGPPSAAPSSPGAPPTCSRRRADLVLANSAADAERFRAVYEGAGADRTA